jgi:hypothetical protein
MLEIKAKSLMHFFFGGGNRFSAPLEIRSAVGLTRLLLTARQFSIGKKVAAQLSSSKRQGPIVLGIFQSARNFGHWKVYLFKSRIFYGYLRHVYGYFLHFPELVALQEMKRLFCV